MTVRRGPRLPAEQLAPFLLDFPGLPHPSRRGTMAPAAPPVPLDWRAVFGNDRPVEVEVGCGKGLFLATAAAARPDVNFLGVEIVRKYQLLTATRVAHRGLSNARVACADARPLLRWWVADGSLQAVHVYFPDPWWKKRHQKRRVFTDEFAAECSRVLRPGGILSVATDVEDYARLVGEVVAAQTALVPLPPPEPNTPAHDLDYLTNFERKFRQQGKPIFRLRYRRPEGVS
jgi:tRNA (guanine-N7-)-methyltransferase